MTTTFDELHQQIIKRTLKQMDLRYSQSISGLARSRLHFQQMTQTFDSMIWTLRTNIWAEEIEDLEKTISIRHPKNFIEYVKCVFYESLVRDWNYTDFMVRWLKGKFPVKYITISKTCRLKTVAKYPQFNYEPLPDKKFGPYRLYTMDQSGAVEKNEEE